MHRDLARMTHYLVVLIHVGRPKVDQDINDEHDVDRQIDDSQRVVVPVVFVPRPADRGLRAPPAVLFVQEERGDVRGEDRRVDDEDENEPVPHGLGNNNKL